MIGGGKTHRSILFGKLGTIPVTASLRCLCSVSTVCTRIFPCCLSSSSIVKGTVRFNLVYHHLISLRSPQHESVLRSPLIYGGYPVRPHRGAREAPHLHNGHSYLICLALFMMILQLTTFLYTTKYGVPARQVRHSGFTVNRVDLCMRINNRNMGIPLQIRLNERT